MVEKFDNSFQALLKRLNDEVRDHSPIVRTHTQAVSVEDSGDLNIDTVLAVVIHKVVIHKDDMGGVAIGEQSLD